MTALPVCLFLVSLLGSARAEPTAEQTGLRLGYSTGLLFDVTRADAEAAVSLWARELARATGFAGPTSATLYDDVSALAAEVRAGALDVVAMSSLDFLGLREQQLLEPALVGLKGGRVADRQLLLVRRDSGLRVLADLRGKVLSVQRTARDLATLWLDTLLAREGLPRTTAFLGVTREDARASKALLPVFFRRSDACVVNDNAFATAVELNPQLGRELMVLAQSPEFPLGLVCLRAGMDPERKQQIVGSSFQVVTTPAGRQILTLFKVDEVARFEPSLLRSLEQLLREHEALERVARRER